jgi:hypothetical protein
MSSYTVRHIIDTDIDTFWKLTFDQSLARIMLKKLGNQGDFRVLEERTEGQLTHRRIDWISHVELPSFVQKFVGDGSYFEVGTFDAAAKRYTGDCIPKLSSEKFLSHFVITVEPIEGGKRCARVITTENTIKVFGVGGMIAKLLEHGQRESHDASAKFLNGWLQENPLGAANAGPNASA